MFEKIDPSLEWLDVLVIALYFAVVIGVGLWATCRATTDNASGFFLAGKTTHWILIGASTFSTNVGAPMFLGLAGSAAATGIAVTMFEWHAMWMLLLLGWVFLPVYTACGCYTMPQYLQLRFGGRRIRVWIAIIYTIVIIISHISGQMYAGAVFVKMIFNWDIYGAKILILGITAIFTVLGGLKAVIWTDTIQTAILILGSFTVSAIALDAVGGFQNMTNRYMTAVATNNNYYNNNNMLDNVTQYVNNTCGYPPSNALHIFRPADSGDYPWPGMTLGLTILALNAWCTDQTCVQRSLSAKNMLHAKAGLIVAAYLKVLSFFFFIIPGMISRVLFPDRVACSDPTKCQEICQNAAGCSNLAYPLLVLNILPVGVRGILMAALLSALVSSLTSIFNSSSTVFTIDLWSICRPRANVREKMIVGRLWIVILAVVGTLWLPVLQHLQGSQFWSYTQSIYANLNPPIVMAFLFGIFWKRTTEKGVFSGLVAGLIVSAIRVGLQWSHVAPICGSGEPDNRFAIISKVHYLHFAIMLAVISSVVIIIVSLFTEPRTEAQLRRVTWWTRSTKELQETSEDEEEEEEKEKCSMNGEQLENEKELKVEICDQDKTVVMEDSKLKIWKQEQTKADYVEEYNKENFVDKQETSNDEQQEVEKNDVYNSKQETTDRSRRIKLFALKWLCGVNVVTQKIRLTRAERTLIALKVTNLEEDPFWRRVVNINGLVCCTFCVFLHGYWF